MLPSVHRFMDPREYGNGSGLFFNKLKKKIDLMVMVEKGSSFVIKCHSDKYSVLRISGPTCLFVAGGRDRERPSNHWQRT